MAKVRVTSKYLIKWVNDKLISLEIDDFECYNVARTYFTTGQYEGGACYLYIKMRSKQHQSHEFYFLCFYPMKYLQDAINYGSYELFIKFDRNGSISNAELDLRKII